MPSSEHDDLTAIKGIGPKTATTLEKLLGIATFAALAARSVDEIGGALEESGARRPSPDDIEAWIAEAAQRSAADASMDDGDSNETATTALHDWSNEASFVVNFESRDVVHQVVDQEHQMVVREIESDIGEQFSVDDGAAAFRWMQTQLETARQAKTTAGEKEPAGAVPATKEPVYNFAGAVRVSYIELEQGSLVNKASAEQAPESRILGVARIHEPAELRVGFTVEAEHVDALVEAGVSHTAEIYVHAWAGDTVRIGPSDPRPISSGTTEYVVPLRHSFGAIGLYRVRAVVNLATDAPVADYLEAPMLQIY